MTVYVIPYDNTEWISGVGEMYRLANWKKLVGKVEPDIEHKQKLMVQLVPEPNNQYDKKAIALHVNGIHVGYLPSEVAAKHFKTVLPIYNAGDALVAYGSIWVIQRGDDLNTNVSVNLPKKISVPDLLTLESAPDQPTRSPASKVSNVLTFGTSSATGVSNQPGSSNSTTLSNLLQALVLVAKILGLLIVTAIIQGITSSGVIAFIFLAVGAAWLFGRKKIRAYLEARKKKSS